MKSVPRLFRPFFVRPSLPRSTLAQPPETQRQVVDRRQFLNEVQTSDDPRRVPAPPGPRGPEGTRVLYGGFIFDGTGAEPRIGTVVIERNRIAAILGEGETGLAGGLPGARRLGPHRPAGTD